MREKKILTKQMKIEMMKEKKTTIMCLGLKYEREMKNKKIVSLGNKN